MFQVRGSVAASGGHDPEQILREQMDDWGLEQGVDYNTTDVVIELSRKAASVEEKSRAYDFVLPFKAPGWAWTIFVQSQFYAGDSGSVSHKNVDQTGKSRPKVLDQFPTARFAELVDGAGYFASLNSDLKNLLRMPTTSTFFQLRSAPIRLRRELQRIGYLAPLEVEHAALMTDGRLTSIGAALKSAGYKAAEVKRCIASATRRGILKVTNDKIEVTGPRRELARRYFLLDLAACEGKPLETKNDGLRSYLMVPGYGAFHGLKMDELGRRAVALSASFKQDWASDPALILSDLRWLCDRGFMAASA